MVDIFQICTDHNSLYFLEQRISSLEQQRWITKLFGFDHEITCKRGSENLVADAFSRLLEHAKLVAISIHACQTLELLRVNS